MSVRALLLAVALAACGGRQPTTGVTSDDSVFYLKSNVRDASVFIDGKYIGTIGTLRGGIAVVAGRHRVEVRHDDYFSRYVELDLQRAERRKIDVTMAPVLP